MFHQIYSMENRNWDKKPFPLSHKTASVKGIWPLALAAFDYQHTFIV
ncbi:hypothetical protein J2T12_003811 [Paenibacillus anaericanus]|nr:hypothetical protein [Paenibacillus anaericanus]